MQTAAFTWAGSQLTKGFRAAVAIALAKPVDALIRRTSMKLNVDYGKVVFAMFTFTYLMPCVGCNDVCCSLRCSSLRLYCFFSFDLVFQIVKYDGIESRLNIDPYNTYDEGPAKS